MMVDWKIDDFHGVDEFYAQALLLSKTVERTLAVEGNLKLSAKPTLEKSGIVSFMNRMRVWSFGKFKDENTYVSSINFYKNDLDMGENKPIGAIIVYVGEEFLPFLLKRFGYPLVDEDDEEGMMDAVGTFANLVGAKFNTGLNQLGYIDLSMSYCSNYKNEVIDGVKCDIKEREKYEASFYVKNEKRICIDLSMGDIPKIPPT